MIQPEPAARRELVVRGVLAMRDFGRGCEQETGAGLAIFVVDVKIDGRDPRRARSLPCSGSTK